MTLLRTRVAVLLCAAVGLLRLGCPRPCAAAEDVDAALHGLAAAIESGDSRAVARLYAGEGSRGADQLWRRWGDVFAAYDDLEVELEVLLRGVAGKRALVRCTYTVTGRSVGHPDGPRYLVSAPVVDVPLERDGDGWLLGAAEWPRPDAEGRMARVLASAGSLPEYTIVHIVLRMHGGVWWPVRHLVWAGDIGPQTSAGAATDTQRVIGTILEQHHALNEPGTLHVFVAKQGDDREAVQYVWHGAAEAADAEQQLRTQTARAEATFGDAGEHVRLAELLYDAGRYALAVEEYEKGTTLDPSAGAGGGAQRARRALQRHGRQREWEERLNAQRAAELAMQGGGLAQDRSAVSRAKPPQVLICEHGIVRHHSGEHMIADVMAALEEAHRNAITVFGFPMKPVSVSVFRSKREYQAFRQWRGETRVPEWSGGTSGVDGILTYSHKGVGKSIAHEYGHEAVHQFVLDASVPVWLDEGIATIMEDSFADHQELTAELYRRRRGAFFAIDDLSGPWTRLPGEMARYAYAQARGMVEFALARWGREAVLRVLRDLRRGATYDEALARNLGVSQAGFEQQWAQYTVSRMPRMRRQDARTRRSSGEASPGGPR